MAHDFNKFLVYLQSQLSFLIRVIGIFSGKICQRCLLTIVKVDLDISAV